MGVFAFHGVCLVLVIWTYVGGQEPTNSCCNKFEYEFQVLQKLVQLENDKTTLKNTLGELNKQLQDALSMISYLNGTYAKSQTSTYIRWGRTTCPENGAEIVYQGYAAGSHYSHSGGGANYLCIPRDPIWSQYSDSSDAGGRELLYGVEYEITSEIVGPGDQGDGPCVVCRIPRSTFLMVPGRNVCYDEWTLEYSGYLSTQHHSHASNKQYVCLDSDFEVRDGTGASTDGATFHLVEGRCGAALPCPPYVNGREITCAVCSY